MSDGPSDRLGDVERIEGLTKQQSRTSDEGIGVMLQTPNGGSDARLKKQMKTLDRTQMMTRMNTQMKELAQG